MNSYYAIRKRKIIVVLLVFLFTGCKENKKNDAESILTFRKENAITLKNSGLFVNKTIVPLEIKEYKSEEHSLINKGATVYKDDENLFVYSRDLAYPILRFDTEGNFKNKIGSFGNGPNELVNVMDIVINREKSIIEVLTNEKIVFFTFDGTPIESKKIDLGGIWAASFTYVDNNYWFYTGNNTAFSSYRLYQTDQSFNIIKKGL